MKKILLLILALLLIPTVGFAAISVPWNRIAVGTESPIYTADGILVTASSTIGTGTATSGLTVFGGATTTGVVTLSNYTSGALAVGTIGNLYTYATSSASTASSTLLSDNNTFSGNNIFSLLLKQSAGFISQASSTVVGNFTSTGNGIFSGTLGVATTSPSTTFGVVGSGYFTGGLGVGLLNTTAGTLKVNSTGTFGNTTDSVVVDGTTHSISMTNGGGGSMVMQRSAGDTLLIGGGNLNHIYFGISPSSSNFALSVSGNNLTTGGSLLVGTTLGAGQGALIGRDDNGALGGPLGGLIRAGNSTDPFSQFGGPLSLQGGLSGGNNHAGGLLYLAGGQSTGTAQGGAIIFATAAASTTSGFTVNSTTTRMTITGNGYIGIGTTTPTVPLQIVASTTNATTTVQIGQDNQNKGTCLVLYDVAGTAWYFSIDTTGMLTGRSASCN